MGCRWRRIAAEQTAHQTRPGQTGSVGALRRWASLAWVPAERCWETPSIGAANAGGGSQGGMWLFGYGWYDCGRRSRRRRRAVGSGVEQWRRVESIALGGTSRRRSPTRSARRYGGLREDSLGADSSTERVGRSTSANPAVRGLYDPSTISSLSGKTGTLTCIANTNPLVLEEGLWSTLLTLTLLSADGTPYILMGFEADWLGLMDFGDAQITHAKSLIDIYTNHGFNEALVNLFAYDTTWNSRQDLRGRLRSPCCDPWEGTYPARQQDPRG